MLTIAQAVQGFNAVASDPRLEVLQTLVRAGSNGLSIGQIQSRVEQPASTLAHHLRFLNDGGLINQEKKGREVINRADYKQIQALASFLLKECCIESDTDNDC